MSKVLNSADARIQSSIINQDTRNTPLGILVDFMAGGACSSPEAENFALQSQTADTLEAVAALISQAPDRKGFLDFGGLDARRLSGVLDLCAALSRFSRDVSEVIATREEGARNE